jgi:hypothetical protein
MRFSKRSPLTGEYNVMDIPVTIEQIETWKAGVLIQRAMPNLTPDQREFLMTGYTPSDWEKMFGSSEKSAGGEDDPDGNGWGPGREFNEFELWKREAEKAGYTVVEDGTQTFAYWADPDDRMAGYFDTPSGVGFLEDSPAKSPDHGS